MKEFAQKKKKIKWIIIKLKATKVSQYLFPGFQLVNCPKNPIINFQTSPIKILCPLCKKYLKLILQHNYKKEKIKSKIKNKLKAYYN